MPDYPSQKPEHQWQQELTKQQYRVMREGGTEPPFSGQYYDFNQKGCFYCAACGHILFHSHHKFDSGTGWPSFTQPDNQGAIQTREEQGLRSNRTEVLCAGCHGHLGHVFNDGPEPTGLRYCINSIALMFQEQP